ncbi:MAG: hypothetical protein ACRCV6_01940 [Formosimonas sp.]
MPIHTPADSTQPETYQGNASPHNVMVQHINQVLAAEYRHSMAYQHEQAQLEAEQQARHARERADALANHLQHTPLEETDMNLKQFAAAALTAGTLAATGAGVAGCQDNYSKYIKSRQNGHEIEYDRTENPALHQVIIDASKSPTTLNNEARLLVFYDIENKESCLPPPDNWVSGVREYSTQRMMEYPVHQNSQNTFTGEFPVNIFESKNYFTFGSCIINIIDVSMEIKDTEDRVIYLEIGDLEQNHDGSWDFKVNKNTFNSTFINYFTKNGYLPVRVVDPNKKYIDFSEPNSRKEFSQNDIFPVTVSIKGVK